MTITFFTNQINHHQIPLSDEFYKVLADDYRYVALERLPEEFIKNGYDDTLNRSYIIKAYESENSMNKAKELIDSSDVVIIGHAPDCLFWEREKANKVTFHYSERWLKKGLLRALNPITLYHFYINHIRFRNKRTYMLCASAFTASDVNLFGAYPHKCFKWGYFTKVPVETPKPAIGDCTRIMWCARMIDWKHPELAVLLAKELKEAGQSFILDMYGSGTMKDSIQKMIDDYQLSDYVKLCGNVPNEEILSQMREHDIFLFTSDRGEGWGAVANEAMANGCVLVGSDEIGAVPYLIEDNVNGCVFKSKDISSLYTKVLWLIDNPQERIKLANNAYVTMRDVWSPEFACARFLDLAKFVLDNKLQDYSIKDGPASWA